MIAIVDYGMGNLRSVAKAIERVGGEARIVRTPSDLSAGAKVVLPGVGAFEDGMSQLGRQELIGPLTDAIKKGKPFLGVCLGMQMLFDLSCENGEHTGLGVFAGTVKRFDFGRDLAARNLRIPHMGWNQLRIRRDCPLLAGVESGQYVFFAHSYHVAAVDREIITATTDYGYEFSSMVWRKNVFAAQFHPEKSQDVGLRILRNFVDL